MSPGNKVQAGPLSKSETWASRWRRLKNAAWLYGVVGLGSVIGGTARWLVPEGIDGGIAGGLPWGTIFVNVSGSFLIGLYAGLTEPDGRLLAGPRQRQFVMTGICGGYTTFSIFSLETLRFLQAAKIGMAALNVGLSVAGWLLAVWAGHALATRFNRLRRT